MENTDIVKILIIDESVPDVDKKVVAKYQFPSTEADKIKTTILDSINKIGKASHALIKYRNEFFTANHTAEGKLQSEHYERTKVTYHPNMNVLN